MVVRILHSPKVLLAAAFIIFLFGAAAVYFSLTSSGGDGGRKSAVVPTQVVAPASRPTSLPASPTPEPTPVPEIPIARLLIPAINVDAEVVTKGVDASGAMQDPSGPFEVAWYNFSVLPGHTGNIVMAGHLDYINVGAAVFYHLDDLKEGDEVVINLDNGEKINYKVTTVAAYVADTAPVQEIVGPTPVETVTLITCGGTFNRSTREYDKRVVVRAVRA